LLFAASTAVSIAGCIAASIAVWQKNSGCGILAMEMKAVLSIHYITAFLCASAVNAFTRKNPENRTKMDQNGPKWTIPYHSPRNTQKGERMPAGGPGAGWALRQSVPVSGECVAGVEKVF
jgi:hypothetical protein